MPGAVAEAMIELCQILPETTRMELKKLLAYDLSEAGVTFANPGSRIGLLTQVLSARNGELPSVIDYDEARRRCSTDWPSGATLSKEYGGWIRAVSAALSLTTGSHRTRRATRGIQVKGKPYTQQELIAALWRFRSDLGDWPTGPGEYSRWARLARAAETRWGSNEKRIPGLNAFPTCFGTFAAAVDAANVVAAPPRPPRTGDS